MVAPLPRLLVSRASRFILLGASASKLCHGRVKGCDSACKALRSSSTQQFHARLPRCRKSSQAAATRASLTVRDRLAHSAFATPPTVTRQQRPGDWRWGTALYRVAQRVMIGCWIFFIQIQNSGTNEALTEGFCGFVLSSLSLSFCVSLLTSCSSLLISFFSSALWIFGLRYFSAAIGSLRCLPYPTCSADCPERLCVPALWNTCQPR